MLKDFISINAKNAGGFINANVASIPRALSVQSATETLNWSRFKSSDNFFEKDLRLLKMTVIMNNVVAGMAELADASD